MFDICLNLLEKEEEEKEEELKKQKQQQKEEGGETSIKDDNKKKKKKDKNDTLPDSHKGPEITNVHTSPLFTSPPLSKSEAAKAILKIINKICENASNNKSFFEWNVPPLFLFAQTTPKVNDMDTGKEMNK
jgi:ABC-type Zn2+ transport system substrate-binding protein/surface adhesin